MDSIPVAGFLVPPVSTLPPEGFARIETSLPTGLPATIELDKELSLVLGLPTGLAMPWRDAAAAELVATAEDDLSPVAHPGPSRDPVAEAPLRLQLRRGSVIVASTPLSVGARLRLPDNGDPSEGTLAEVVLLDWVMRAGSVRGAGDVGSRIALAWRRADRAVDQFSEPPVNPHFEPRLPPVLRIESRPYLMKFERARLIAMDLTSVSASVRRVR
jgi:hypothetical protein